VSYHGAVAGSQLILLGLATPSTAEPLTVTRSESLKNRDLYGVGADGTLVCHQVSMSRATIIDGRVEVLLHAGDGLLPGAIMLGKDGGLACLTIAQQGEGEGVYATLANVTLATLLDGDAELPEEGLLTGFTTRIEKGEIIVDWAEAEGVLITEDSIVSVFMAATCNPYLNYDEVRSAVTQTRFPAFPGTQVQVWIAVSKASLPEPLYPEYRDEVAILQIPEAQPVDLYGMRNLRSGVTQAEAGRDGEAADFLPQTPLRRENLSDPDQHLYFQTEDTYEIATQEEGHSLMVLLYTPEGYVFSYESSYVFMPELAGSDLWICDITELAREYERFAGENRWIAGEYKVGYYVDGFEVAVVPFTLD